ncbi:MAG: Cell wall lytic [Cyanobacteria bacterium RYN_339]|nr:Cell wall lytic [Cyanobacteria bacterium RYN_339]
MISIPRLTQNLLMAPVAAPKLAADPRPAAGDLVTFKPRQPADPILGSGSSGEAVKWLQASLRELGYFTYPTDTGTFGAVTADAVARFQKDHGLEVSGRVGNPTQDAISRALDAARPAPTVNWLTRGDSGEAVKELQRGLRHLGFFDYPSDTGFYGDVTEAAVMAYQRAQGQEPDGVASAALRAAVKALNPVQSEIQVDPNTQPRAHSTIPGYGDSVEQCGEFAYRYFKAQGKNYPTQGQPYDFMMTGKGAFYTSAGLTYREQPQFERHLNGGAEPPRAGDILVAKGPKPGQFHTAIVTRVDGEGVHVLQANVPYNWIGGKETEGVFPLDGTHMPALPTSQKGYNDDYAVVGWIHPTGEDAL